MKSITLTLPLLILAVGASAGNAPTITQQPTNQTSSAGETAAFTVAVSGTGPFSYQWRFDGTNLPNASVIVAGNGSYEYSGDGGPATNAGFSGVFGVAADGAGNLLIADSFGQRVRRVDTNGIINVVAGNGGGLPTGGAFSGDGGPATNASLNFPNDVAVDRFGNLFIADTHNDRIREVRTNGIIVTVAGNGTNGYSGDGGAATNASLRFPGEVTVDSLGNLIFSDGGNNRVRRVGTDGIITTVAGNGIGAPDSGAYSGDGGAATNASLSAPMGIALDRFGNLFLADCGNNRVRKVETNGIITTVAGNGAGPPFFGAFSGDGGPATNASLSMPSGLAVDDAENLFFADFRNLRVRKVAVTGIISTISEPRTNNLPGGGQATNGMPEMPYGIAVDKAGNVFIANCFYGGTIRKVIAQGPTFTLRNVNFTDAGNYDVVVTSPYGGITSSVASLGVTAPRPPAPVKKP